MPRETSNRKEGYLFLGLYALLFLVVFSAGDGMYLPYADMHYLDPFLLANRFRESIINLHSQPPLMNIVFGALIHVEMLTRVRLENILLIANFILGGAAVLAVAELSRSMVPDRRVHLCVMAALLLNPMLYEFALIYYSTFYELALLAFIAVFVRRYAVGGRFRHYAAVCALTAALVYTRSLFHFAWALAVIAALPALGTLVRGRGRPAYTRKVVACMAATAVLLLAWPAKNYVRFGFFGYSSWQGYNLASGLPVALPPVLGTFDRPYFDDVTDAQIQSAMSYVPERFRDVPALTEVVKPDKSPNWNHYAVIVFSREMALSAYAAMRENPSLLLRKAARNYFRGWSMYEGRVGNSFRIFWMPETDALQGWMRAYEALLFQYFGGKIQDERAFYYRYAPKGPVVPLTVLAFVFPAVMAGACYAAFRGLKGDAASAVTAGFMLYCILWVLLMTVLVDGIEGKRYRFPVEPFTFILAGWLLARLMHRKKPPPA